MEIKAGSLVVGFNISKLNPSNVFRITLNNRLPSNVNSSTFEKAISVYTTKYV